MAGSRLINAPRTYVPTDYSDLFQTYFPYVKFLVSRGGIDPLNVEDVAMTVLSKFLEKDALADFDPEHTVSYGGVDRKTVFSTFLTGFITIYLRHYRDRQNIQRSRERIVLDMHTRSVEKMIEQQTVGDLIIPPTVETYEDLYTNDLEQHILRHLRSLPDDGRTRKISLESLFLRVAEQVRVRGDYHVPTLAKDMNVSVALVRNWMVKLKAEISVALQDY